MLISYSAEHVYPILLTDTSLSDFSIPTFMLNAKFEKKFFIKMKSAVNTKKWFWNNLSLNFLNNLQIDIRE